MPIIWIAHKDITLDNTYHVNYGRGNRSTKTRTFSKFEKAKAFAKAKGKSFGMKKIDYHDSKGVIHELKVE